ncbi:hypothetical protein BABA_18637 [Neobacillus bataviensis LMG 21833]|uniref:Uncharacterized protein n=1 Tax=Neobacillus bataviensis LMG 21833 TaxID=1117379 RepID=K6DCK6_9BACI|nr:hypothetical protein [Neobacillus bataviensis]EKN65808.1 hypothetical protein BABA_18637 [Neobacillus bataviensis LMG 21833]
MSLKDVFLLFRKNDEEQELKKKLLSLERNIEELKKSLQDFQEQKPKGNKPTDPPIIIEKINIEKIILDKYELNNNFGQLGIKELKGKLNIGATYGSEFTPKLDEEDINEDEENKGERNVKGKMKKPSAEKGPKVTIHAKKEN